MFGRLDLLILVRICHLIFQFIVDLLWAITNLLDPNQRNLQLKWTYKYFIFHFYARNLVFLGLFFRSPRWEKMSNLASLLKISQKSIYVQWRMWLGAWWRFSICYTFSTVSIAWIHSVLAYMTLLSDYSHGNDLSSVFRDLFSTFGWEWNNWIIQKCITNEIKKFHFVIFKIFFSFKFDEFGY